MRQRILIGLVVLVIGLGGIFYVALREGVGERGRGTVGGGRGGGLPPNYSLDTYEVAERSGVRCGADSECVLPMSYAVRSSCPYTAICLESHCAVVCPGVKQ